MRLKSKIITGKWNKNQYRILKLLGEGGTGIVYKVVDIKTKLYYALKISEDLQSITKESNMLNKFVHLDSAPHALELDDYEENGKIYYFIVIEYINGQNFKQYILRNKMDLKEIVGILIITGEMINDLHKKGYIFGDLKLENVMIDRERGKIKIIDLGGLVQVGASIKEFTPLYDRARLNMGSRCADTNYDLFSICMMTANLIIRNEKKLLDMTVADIVYELKKKRINRKLVELLKRGLYQERLKFDEFIYELKKIYKNLRTNRKIVYNDKVNLAINAFFVGSILSLVIVIIIVIGN
ncbi:serine/threonine protein kinase [Wukongibacter sp. M2B1]|uniref:serine/threonine protein kinase n=1 Tax=Wukongibacter sp. M2B1 TaxID=3088895 RepID=UPI003D7B1F8E